MSILSIGNYKLLEEEAKGYDDIADRGCTLLRDLGLEESLTETFLNNLEAIIGDDAVSVSFFTAYKDYVVPSNLAGMSLIKWVEPEADTEYLEISDFCVPLLIVQKSVSEFFGVIDSMEEFIELKSEARLYDYELRESFKL